MGNNGTDMPGYHARKGRWAVILAGGGGTRLQSLTRLVSGDDRPKQFCPLLGGRTLLSHTRQRIAREIREDRTLFVLLKEQERFYAEELAEVPPSLKVVQPANRGTLPAILYSVLRIMSLDPDAVVAFFPSDHYYADEKNFMAGIELAFGTAETDRDSLILLGSPATYPETDYGWIEAEAALSPRSRNGLLRVKRFWEKPAPHVAKDLWDRGCVWNTFVMVGRAGAFLNMIRSRASELCRAFEFAHGQLGPDMEATVNGIYARIPVADLSSQVLEASPESLGVLCLGDVGWSDLGNPQRLIEVLSLNGETNDWLSRWQNETMRAASIRAYSSIGNVA